MSNQEALRDLIQRFAISALSRERKHEALNEEILVGKYTGEFYIKTKDGVVMSTDIMNREKASADEAIRIAELMGMTGEMYRVDLDMMIMPSHIDYSNNFIRNDVIEIPAGAKEVLLNLDVVEYKIVGDAAEIVRGKNDVKVIFEIDKNGEIDYVRFDTNLQEINFSILPFDDIENINSIKLINITIEKDIVDDEDERAMILHNIFVTVNK